MASMKLARAAGSLLMACMLAAGTAMAQAPQVAATAPSPADLAAEQRKQEVAQPLNNQPVWKEVRSGAPQVTTVRGRETNVLMQPEGQTWRAIRVPTSAVGGWLIALVVLALIGYYAWRGPIDIHGRPTGRVIERFSAVKRITHWATAITFVVLAISGLILTFGKAMRAFRTPDGPS